MRSALRCWRRSCTRASTHGIASAPSDGTQATSRNAGSSCTRRITTRSATVPLGERLCHLVSDGRARMAAALTLLSPMVPMLFQGEEWAASTPFQYFTDLGDAHLRKAVTNGRRREFKAFGWPADKVPDPQSPATFQRSVLRWDEVRHGVHARMLTWYRDLIRIRRSRVCGRGRPARRQRMRGMTACATCCSTPTTNCWWDATSATRPSRCPKPRDGSCCSRRTMPSARMQRLRSMPTRLPSGAAPARPPDSSGQPASTAAGSHKGSDKAKDAPPPGVDSAVISPPWSLASSRER